MSPETNASLVSFLASYYHMTFFFYQVPISSNFLVRFSSLAILKSILILDFHFRVMAHYFFARVLTILILNLMSCHSKILWEFASSLSYLETSETKKS
jgi:hypothetical protein